MATLQFQREYGKLKWKSKNLLIVMLNKYVNQLFEVNCSNTVNKLSFDFDY